MESASTRSPQAIANRGTSSSAAGGPDWKNDRGTDSQGPAGNDLVHCGVGTDADVGGQAEQLDVAIDDPRRPLTCRCRRRGG